MHSNSTSQNKVVRLLLNQICTTESRKTTAPESLGMTCAVHHHPGSKCVCNWGDNMRRLGHINQCFGSQEHRLEMGGCVTLARCDEGLCVVISTAEGLPHWLPDCYPLHHSEHASVPCDILLTHWSQHRRSTHVITTHKKHVVESFAHVLTFCLVNMNTNDKTFCLLVLSFSACVLEWEREKMREQQRETAVHVRWQGLMRHAMSNYHSSQWTGKVTKSCHKAIGSGKRTCMKFLEMQFRQVHLFNSNLKRADVLCFCEIKQAAVRPEEAFGKLFGSGVA